MKIILDAMGGDNAPDAVVRGALEAAKEFGVQIVLVGRGADILASMKAQGSRTAWSVPMPRMWWTCTAIPPRS